MGVDGNRIVFCAGPKPDPHLGKVERSRARALWAQVCLLPQSGHEAVGPGPLTSA